MLGEVGCQTHPSNSNNSKTKPNCYPPRGSHSRKAREMTYHRGKFRAPLFHQIFVRIPDTWTEKGRKPTFTQTMHVPTSLDSLKEGLSLLLSIPKHSFSIIYGGKTLNHQVALEAQGVTKGTTVWLMIGGIFGGADMDMVDSPLLVSSEATPIHRPISTKPP